MDKACEKRGCFNENMRSKKNIATNQKEAGEYFRKDNEERRLGIFETHMSHCRQEKQRKRIGTFLDKFE